MAEVYFDFNIGNIEIGMYKSIISPFRRTVYSDGMVYIFFWKFFIIKTPKNKIK